MVTINKMTFKQKIALVVFLVLVIIAYNLVIAFSRIGETKISIKVIPDDAIVTIDGKGNYHGNVYLGPGQYKFSASKEGWGTDSQTIKVGEESQDVFLIPPPESDGANEFLESHPDIVRERERLGGLRANRFGEKTAESAPIIKALPTYDLLGPYSIDFGPSKTRSDGVFIEISNSTPKGRQAALQWIRDHGQDPTDLEIVYSGFANPILKSGVNHD